MPSSIPFEDCVWPDVTEPYLSAYQQAVKFIAREFNSVVRIFACGSVTRGQHDASSDIDVYVVRRELVRQRVQKFFGGVPAEIFINPPQMTARSLESERHERNLIVAHMLGTGVLVWQCDSVVTDLRDQARQQLERSHEVPANLTSMRYRLATGFEDAVDKLEKDPATARLILFKVMDYLLEFVFISAGQRFSRAKDLLKSVQVLNPDVGELFKRFYLADSLHGQFEFAEQLMDSLVGARGFFEWSSAPEVVLE